MSDKLSHNQQVLIDHLIQVLTVCPIIWQRKEFDRNVDALCWSTADYEVFKLLVECVYQTVEVFGNDISTANLQIPLLARSARPYGNNDLIGLVRNLFMFYYYGITLDDQVAHRTTPFIYKN